MTNGPPVVLSLPAGVSVEIFPGGREVDDVNAPLSDVPLSLNLYPGSEPPKFMQCVYRADGRAVATLTDRSFNMALHELTLNQANVVLDDLHRHIADGRTAQALIMVAKPFVVRFQHQRDLELRTVLGDE